MLQQNFGNLSDCMLNYHQYIMKDTSREIFKLLEIWVFFALVSFVFGSVSREFFNSESFEAEERNCNEKMRR
jgi:hypothetical protein